MFGCRDVVAEDRMRRSLKRFCLERCSDAQDRMRRSLKRFCLERGFDAEIECGGV